MRTVLLSSFAVMALATGAFADLVSATGGTEGPNTATFTDAVVFNLANTGALDSVLGVDKRANGTIFVAGGAADLILDVFYGPGKPFGETTVQIYTGTLVNTISLVSIQYYNQAAGFAAGSASAPVGSVPLTANGLNRFAFNNATLTLVSGFNIATYDAIRLGFDFSNADAPPGSGNGSRLTIDAITNPEPASMALFGLGALSLAGLALRRKQAKKNAAPTA